MEKIKYRIKIETTSDTNSTKTLMDSGATHHFFHSYASFMSYEKCPKQKVEYASGVSIIFGKGAIKLDWNGGIVVESYHLPQFSTTSILVGLLSQPFNLLLTCDPSILDEFST